MQTENRLNITPGDWLYNEGTGKIWANIDRNDNNPIITEVQGAYGVTNSENEANAALIADAGTTANKCGLLPSELLKQRDELREALDGLLRNYCTVFNVTESARVAMAILQSTKQQ